MSHSNRKKHSQLYFVKMLTMNIGELDFYKREIESFQKQKQVSKKKILNKTTYTFLYNKKTCIFTKTTYTFSKAKQDLKQSKKN